ncbi:30S ribosomal protein S14 [Sulfobacillus acidophilus]|uniref:Small ribosomal subunit protein uS14 n=1 Tax=Sulfobacillus acidophilus TaxID=53633 RepID=A0ABS3AW43_9FIRM|nr:30S ribosomal protein S14 [Sulfobacillus acidophilus]
MAKNCQLAREVKREELVKRFAEKRKALKEAVINFDLSDEERMNAVSKLSSLPRDSSSSRLSRRCQVTGSSRAVYRKFRLNRITFREMANDGLLPGVTKSSW